MLYLAAGLFVGLNQAFQAPDAPALFKSQIHQHRSLNHPTMRDKFLALASHAGIVGNYTWSAGATAVASRRPIKTLGDFNGRKIRVLATKMETATLKTVGATGIPMPYSEVLPALQRNAIDGVRSGIIVMGPSKFYTVAKYIYNEKSAFIPSAMWLNRKWLDGLPAKHRAATNSWARTRRSRRCTTSSRRRPPRRGGNRPASRDPLLDGATLRYGLKRAITVPRIRDKAWRCERQMGCRGPVPPALFTVADVTAEREAVRRWHLGTVVPLVQLLELLTHPEA